jgi:cytochrome c-type biogenesis protein CcmE
VKIPYKFLPEDVMSAGKGKFIVGGVFIFIAVIFLIITASRGSIEYFMTVDELRDGGAAIVGKNLRISGAVVGDSIQYDPEKLTLTFEVAHVPGKNSEIEARGGLAKALHDAVTDVTRTHLTISYEGIKPDLLQNEAQAIITGHLGEDGIFYADELLLKCPTKYEEAVPQQVSGNE